ncbi:uncharacterized protein LOC123555179 isoform X2 [Mercenaria mercenaria]|uniref:uncharacterized protein LOC123555179 isoform X2 n=1 Tax=Mercenaria mercenaria TaxID=6596 RepID=UPI00234E41C8|nr:uncharacterized protein LOC123555179 isoform X2 [Mercenaria mercenaria]
MVTMMIRTVLLLLLIGCCYGDDNDVISHLILLDQVPPTIGTNATPEIVIRTNFSGQIEFLEAEKFKVLLNITAPSIHDAYAVTSELIDHKGKLLLQVYEKPGSSPTFSLQWIFLLISCLSGFVLFMTVLYVTWWYSQKKHLGIYGAQGYLSNRHMYRSRNSMQLGAAAELMGDQDNDETDGEEDGERRKTEKVRMSMKPETIIEESEDSCDDDRTNPKLRFQVPVSHDIVQRKRSLRLGQRSQLSNENIRGSGILDYPDQSGDELENDLSPEQKVADADGSYTPLGDLDDMWHDHAVQNSQSTAKLADPRGNLDYNIQTSKSDGDLLGDNKKLSEKEKVIIPLKVEIPKQKRSPNKGITIQKRAEPNIYQKGLNVRPHENDLSSSPVRSDQVRAQVHTPEQHQYVNNSFGQYIDLKTPDQLSRSRVSRESNDAYELYTYPADIPMSTFKTTNASPVKESPVYKVPKKPKPVFHSGSPTNFDFNKLDPKVSLNQPNEPYSPGKFSMLSEGSSSDDFSNNEEDLDDTGDFLRLEDSDIDLPSPDHNVDGDQLSNASLPLPSPPPMENEFMPYDTHGRISQLSPRQSLVTPLDSKEYGTVIALTGSPSPGGPYSKHSVDRFVFPPPPTMYNPPQHAAWARRELNFPSSREEGGDYVGLPMNLKDPPQGPQAKGQGNVPPPLGFPPQPPPPYGYVLADRRDEAKSRERKLSLGKRERKQSGGDKERGPSGGDRERNQGGPDRERRQSGQDRERKQSGSERERKQSSGRKGKAPKHLHLTILTTMCVLSVMSGVYCAVTSDRTRVNIVVYVPAAFPYKNSTIFTAPGKVVKVQDSKGMEWFVSPDPILHKPNGTSKCSNNRCAHTCDDNTGECICRHGYSMDNGICRDINECQTGMIQCSHSQAGCVNVDGTYECLCMTSSNLYEFGDRCLDCRDPCPAGKYEIQPCRGDSKKICKECTKSCGDNFYMKTPCTEDNNAVCLKCQPKCNADLEFEFSQCSATQNRECKAKFRLPKPAMSSNVILDDLAAPNDEAKPIPYHNGVYPSFLLDRGHNGFGSHFWIQVRVLEFPAVVLFQSINHSEAVSAKDFTGNREIIDKYCPYPVPYMYKLKYVKHNNVYYKGDANEGTEALQPCETERESFPDVTKAADESILCSKPGIFADVFQDIKPEEYNGTETVWEEKDRWCREQHERCENCSRSCILQMNAGGSRNCGVSAEDDTGKSPRIPTCVSCCTRDNCSRLCRDYHNDRCKMVKCQKGSLLQFELSPVYPPGDVFYCHVEPILGQRLLVIEYEVNLHKNSELPFFKGKLTLHTDVNWQKTGKIQGTDSILHAEIDSQLKEIPNFIKGKVGDMQVRVGKYSVDGESRFLGTVTSNNNISIQPDSPFGINPKQFEKEKCSDSTMKWENVVTGRSDDICNISKNLIASYEGNSTYLIFDRQKAILKIKLNENISLLKAVRKPTKVFNDTLSANMTMNGTHWIIVMAGEVEDCPGVFSLDLSDPYYLQSPLYHFDVGIECPRKFRITFTVPTGDSRAMSKDMQIQIQDTTGTFILRIHTVGNPNAYAFKTVHEPESTTAREVLTTEKPSYTAPIHFSILFIAVVFGAIVLLVLLLIFGVAWKQGIPEGDIQRFRIRHLVLLVVYITFQFIYALFVSMSVFVMIVIAVNGETTSFLKQYNQQRSVTTALSQLELDSMELHLRTEMARQNAEASTRKADCHSTIQSVIADVEKLQKSIETAAINKVQRQSIKKLVTEHTEATFDAFSRDIQKFRDRYRKYEQYVLDKLRSETESTLQSIQRSKWLRGAQYLYQIVAINKKLMNPGSDMVSFMTWVNMDTDMKNLLKGLTLSLPDLPDLRRSQFIEASDRQARTATLTHKTPLSSQTMNKWFVQPDLHTKKVNSTRTNPEESTKKVSTLDPGSYAIFLVFMVIIDIFWMLHRMIKACGIGQLLLYGYPVYVDVREKKEGPNNVEVKKSNKKSFTSKFNTILNKVLSTLFIPKLIGTLFVCLMVYFVSLCAYKFINRETFSYLGYHNDMEDIMRINEDVMNRRLKSHAERINGLEYKMYENAMNINIQNHQYVLNLVETQWKAIEQSHTNAYCTYLQRINVTASCHGDTGEGTLTEVRPDRCSFPPVLPTLYTRNVTSSSKIAGMQLDGFLLNIRKLINDTCYIIVIYLSAIVIKELLGTVLWIYIKRSGFVSLRIIYETDEAPGSADSSTTNK